MSIPVTFNGQVYVIPEPDEVDWGSNLDAFFVAIAAGCLQKTGGSFTLTGETDFGANFGLKSVSYKSRTANPSTAGTLRLAVSDSIGWRNNANDADLPLAINGSDQLTFNGTPLAASGGGTVNPGIAAKVAVYPANGTILDDTATINGATTSLVLGGAWVFGPPTITYTLPALIGSGDVMMTSGLPTGQTVTSSTTFESSILKLKESGGGIDTVTLAIAALGANRTYTVIDAGTDASFVLSEGTQTINGAKTFSAATFSAVPVFSAGLGSTFFGSSGAQGVIDFYAPTAARGRGRLLITDSAALDSIVTIQVNGSAVGDQTVNIPANSTELVGTTGVQTVSGSKTFNSLFFGANVTANSHKITGLADGTAAQDAATFGQVTAVVMPAGVMVDYGGAAAPTGWLLCDGTSYLRATYPDLFTAIGTTFGSVDGTHFTMPDSRSRSTMGAGTGSGLSARTLGTNVGAETQTTALANYGATGTGSAASQVVSSNTGGNGLYTSGGGGDTLQQRQFNTNSFSTVQPNLVVNKIIKI